MELYKKKTATTTSNLKSNRNASNKFIYDYLTKYMSENINKLIDKSKKTQTTKKQKKLE